MSRTIIAAIFTLFLASTQLLVAQGLDFIKANYTKFEYRIPMRDGKRLFTSVYVPKDQSQTWPILMNRTPYSVGPYGVDQYRKALGPNEQLARNQYIFVYQDVRGRFMSEGVFQEMTPQIPHKQGNNGVDESSDTYDTIDWLVKNIKGNNGRVGIWGISYPGFYAAASLIDSHPALKAVSPQAPIADLYMGDDAYHNGAFYLAANFGFYPNFGPLKKDPQLPKQQPEFDFGTPDGYDFYLRLGPLANADEKYFKRESVYWTDLLSHTTYDEFWKARSLTPHIVNVKPEVLIVGGWFDAEDLAGPLNINRQIAAKSPTTATHLVMGPWSHGGWARTPGDRLGDVRFNAKTSDYFREKIEVPFFESVLKRNEPTKLPRASVFETGTNQWQQFDSWPPPRTAARSLYFHSGNTLSFDAPTAKSGYNEYISDPNKPVPFIGYTALDMVKEYMTADQRFAGQRPDVLVYQTAPLEEDVTVAGPLQTTLHITSTGTDSDFVVKLIDVYPDNLPDDTALPNVKLGGYQQLIRGEPFRARFRNSFEKPEPLTPGKVTKVEYTMPDVFHTFRAGHRIMVQVQSSWFPLTDRNPQKFVDIPNAKSSDFQKATQRIYHSSTAASKITIQVLR